MAPPKLTEEELFLKQQYKLLQEAKSEYNKLLSKKKLKLSVKKEVTPAKPSKNSNQLQSPLAQNSEMRLFVRNQTLNQKPITSAEAAANTESAKKLIAQGLLKLNVEKKTSFKRSSNLKRRLLSDDSQSKKMKADSTDEQTPSDSDERIKKKRPLTSAASSPLASSSSLHADADDKDVGSKEAGVARITSDGDSHRQNPRKKQVYNNNRNNGPKKGNTIYVWGYKLSEEMLRENFKSFGTIVDIKLKNPNATSGFVSFDSFDAAEKAIKEMHDCLVDDFRLRVNLARNQPLRHLAEQTWKELSRERSDKGFNNRDSRNLVVYDDNDCFAPS